MESIFGKILISISLKKKKKAYFASEDIFKTSFGNNYSYGVFQKYACMKIDYRNISKLGEVFPFHLPCDFE